MDGKYASIRDIGNALAGLNAKNKDFAHEPFQRMSGALHQKKGVMGVVKARLGAKYGPAPEYGEESCQHIMSKIGYTRLHKSYFKWKQANNHFNYSRFDKLSNIHF